MKRSKGQGTIALDLGKVVYALVDDEHWAALGELDRRIEAVGHTIE